MHRVRIATHAKIGLWSAISMLIGSIVGIGIFFKNGNVFKINDFNAIAILVAWVMSGIISLCAAISFAEVGSSIDSKAGLGGWCEKLVGFRFGKFVKTIQPIFYFTVLAFAISIFVSEAIFNIFSFSNKVHFSVIMIIGFVIFTLFLFFNFISLKISAKFAVVTTALKFIPLFMVIFAGIIYALIDPSKSLLVIENNTITKIGPFNFSSVLVSIPAILFAYDPFFGVGNLSKEMKNPRQNVPLTIVIAMTIVTIFYILVTVSQLLVGHGSVYTMFSELLASNQTASISLNIIISVFIFIAIIGVMNSFCALIIRSFQSIVDEQLVIGAAWFKQLNHTFVSNYYNEYKGSALLAMICYAVVFIILFIPSAIFNTDAFVDGFSNFPVTIFFGIYGTVILGGIFNRFSKKIVLHKIKGFMFAAPIAVIGCYLVLFAQVFYTYSTDAFLDPFGIINWGLFSQNSFNVQKWMGGMLFFIYIIAILVYYLISNCVLNKHVVKEKKILRVTNYD